MSNSLSNDEHFRKSEPSLSSLMNQVMGRDVQLERQKLDAFERQFTKDNPNEALHIANSLLSNAQYQAKSLAGLFAPFSQAIARNQLTSTQNEELIRLIGKLPLDSQVMNAFKKDYPEFSKQAEQFIKRNEQQLMRIKTIDKELDI